MSKLRQRKIQQRQYRLVIYEFLNSMVICCIYGIKNGCQRMACLSETVNLSWPRSCLASSWPFQKEPALLVWPGHQSRRHYLLRCLLLGYHPWFKETTAAQVSKPFLYHLSKEFKIYTDAEILQQTMQSQGSGTENSCTACGEISDKQTTVWLTE